MTTRTANLLNGSEILGYTIEKFLGSGGMGTVYQVRARDGSRFALKLIDPGVIGEREQAESTARFQREAHIQSRLNHPGLVKVHDAGTHEDQMYLCLELVDGETLREVLSRDHPLPIDWCIERFKDLSSAVAYLHDRSIIHRDLKSSNILVSRRSEFKIADFGLARAAGQTKLTQANTLIGTIGYLAPEILNGGEFTPDSDVYALGLVFYEMLTDRLPFSGRRPHEWMVNILTKDPLPLESLRKGVPPKTHELIRAMMLKKASDRPTIRDVIGFIGGTLASLERQRAPVPRDLSLSTQPKAPPPPQRAQHTGSRPPSDTQGPTPAGDEEKTVRLERRIPTADTGSTASLKGHSRAGVGLMGATIVVGLLAFMVWPGSRGQPLPAFRSKESETRSSDAGSAAPIQPTGQFSDPELRKLEPHTTEAEVEIPSDVIDSPGASVLTHRAPGSAPRPQQTASRSGGDETPPDRGNRLSQGLKERLKQLKERRDPGRSGPGDSTELPLEETPVYRDASERNSAYAQFKLAGFYERGEEGAPRDMELALEWYRKSAAGGYDLAVKRLEELGYPYEL